MRIAVFGAGGVGGYFGGRLAQAGEDVVFIARGEHLQAMQVHGLRVESLKGNFVIHPVQATDDPTQVGIVDVVLVGVKAWQVPQITTAMRSLIGPDTYVVPLQNGIEAPTQLAEALGTQHVLGGLCALVSFMAGPAHIRHAAADPYIRFGELDNRPSARVERLRQAFMQAGVIAEVPPDIWVALWMKFLFIVPVSGIGAVTHAPLGVLRDLSETRQMIEQGLHEVATLARARGIALPDHAVATTLELIDRAPPAATFSLQRDLMEGRPSELEAQVGAAVHLGREAGVAIPLLTFVYHSLLPLELRARGRVEFPR